MCFVLAIRLCFILDPGLFRVVSVIIFVRRPQREKTGKTQAGVGLGVNKRFGGINGPSGQSGLLCPLTWFPCPDTTPAGMPLK